MGKEIERQLTPDEIALKEIQGYIDRVETQTETQQPQQITQQPVQQPVQDLPVTSQTSVGAMSTEVKPKIQLPLDQAEVEGGLKKGVVEGIRWLAEWCVMMIKKYPGRVFYLPQNTNK